MKPAILLTRFLTGAIGLLGAISCGCVSFNYGPSPFTCKESKECPTGYQCVANRCEIPGTDLAAGDWGRDSPGNDGGKGDRTPDNGAWFFEASTDSHSPNLNLVINPGFEDGNTGWELFNAKVVSGGKGSPSALQLDGNIEMQMRQGSQLISGERINNGIGEELVMGGRFYTFGFQAQASFNTSVVANAPFSQLEWLNPADVPQGQDNILVTTSVDGWQDLMQVFQAPVGATKVRITFLLPFDVSGGTVLFDDIIFRLE